jgi:mannose-1-phosphate guanylyltransferase
VLSGHDLSAQLALHEQRGAEVTLHLTEVEDARAFGCVPTDDSGRVTAFLEKMPEPITNHINAGCYIFRRRVVDSIPAGRPVSVERDTFPLLLDRGALILGYLEAAYWLDVGTPAAYVRGSADLVLGLADSPALPGPAGPFLALPGADINADAYLAGGTAVGADARVGGGVVLDGSVVMDDAEIGDGAVVRRSVVGRAARVGAGCVLDEAFVGDGASVGPGNELRFGARVWVDAELPAGAIRFSSDA